MFSEPLQVLQRFGALFFKRAPALSSLRLYGKKILVNAHKVAAAGDVGSVHVTPHTLDLIFKAAPYASTERIAVCFVRPLLVLREFVIKHRKHLCYFVGLYCRNTTYFISEAVVEQTAWVVESRPRLHVF